MSETSITAIFITRKKKDEPTPHRLVLLSLKGPHYYAGVAHGISRPQTGTAFHCFYRRNLQFPLNVSAPLKATKSWNRIWVVSVSHHDAAGLEKTIAPT